MKLLIFKYDGLLSAEQQDIITKSLHEGIQDGVVFLNGDMNYEVVEFDSIRFDYDKPDVKPDKRDVIRRKLEKSRKRLDEYKSYFEQKESKQK